MAIGNGSRFIIIFVNLSAMERGGELREQLRGEVRKEAGKHKHATVGCLDSQSVKRVGVSSCFGYDAGKKVKGGKRHILVDT